MYGEHGEIDSDCVFVSLWAASVGAPMTYAAVDELVGRIRARLGFDFTLHMLHTHAAELIHSGVAIEVVARLLTHRSSTTTSPTYYISTSPTCAPRCIAPGYGTSPRSGRDVVWRGSPSPTRPTRVLAGCG